MERTYVFNQDGGTGANNGLLASILPSLQSRGIDTGYLKGQMAEMSKNMSDLMDLNKRLMEQLGVVEASKNKK